MELPQITLDLTEAYTTLAPLALIIGCITVYGVFVFNFYRFLARKDMFTLDLQKHNQARLPALRKTVSVVLYIFMFLILYPVFVFLWFGVMAGLLYILSGNQTMETVMLIAMGVVGAIRVCSYYSESLATDIAKILPFSLLALTIIDNSIIRIVDSAEGVQDAVLHWETIIDNSVIRIVDSTEGVRGALLQWETIVYYLVAVVVLEFALRIATGNFGSSGSDGGSASQGEQAAEPETEPGVTQSAPARPGTEPDSHVPSPASDSPAPGARTSSESAEHEPAGA